MNFTTDYFKNINLQRSINNNGIYIQMNKEKEQSLVGKMRVLEMEMKTLEDFICDYWEDEDVPDIYSKLVHFLNKKFEEIDMMFLELSELDAKASNVILDEVETILETLERRISVVSNFMINTDELVAC